MKYTIHLKPEVHTLRIFEEGSSYDDRSEPLLSATVHYISDKELYVCNTVGNLSRTLLRNILEHFYKQGYEIFRYERRGHMRNLNLPKLLGNIRE